MGLGRRVVLVAAFAVSFVAAALLSSHVLPSRVLARGRSDAAACRPMPARRWRRCHRLSISTAWSRLSDPAADTRWAPVLRATVARDEPSPKAAPVGQLPTLTPDGTTNIVVADGEADVDGATWVRVGLSVLPNDTEGWVPRSSLGGWSFVDTRLVIDRARFTATLYRAGRVIFRCASRRWGSGHTDARRTVLRA